MSTIDFKLHRSPFGRLVLTTADGEAHEGVVPVRAFPIAAPQEGVSLVGPDGHELAWIPQLAALPDDLRTLIDEELAGREFMPEILQLYEVSTFATPSTWRVRTERGDTSFILRGEEDIRRVQGPTMMVIDSHGIQFLIRDLDKLDRHSRRLLDRFL